jgi:hypothetical protein
LVPLPIAADPIWREPAVERSDLRSAWREFAAAGLADANELDRDAAVMLDVLAHPTVEYTAVMLDANGITGAVAGARGHEVTVAVRRHDRVTLAAMRGASLPDTLVRQLPDARAAPIDAVNIRTTELATPGEPDGLPDGLVGNPVDLDPWANEQSPAQRDTHTLTRLRGLPVIGHGELWITIRDAYGRQRRSDLVRYQDYRIGRIVAVVDRGYLSIAPASKTFLRDRLAAAHRQLDHP